MKSTRIETRLRSYFGLRTLPFTKDLDPEGIFETPTQEKALERLRFLVDRKGIGILIGAPGCGKSTVLRKLKATLGKTSHKICYLHQTTCASVDLYREIARGFGLEPRHRKADIMRELSERLLTISRSKRIRPVLIIDEAHLLHAGFLDELRVLTNFDEDGTDELVLILCGHPQLESNLSLGINEALAQRIVVRTHLSGLSKDEVEGYLLFRLEKAGRTGKLFLPDAIEAVGKGARGVPRIVDRIAETSLILAMEKKRKEIDAELVLDAIDEVNP
jgi:type II secretory pathway predicted ATPase ExeA